MRNILLACAVAFFAVACWGQTQDNPAQNDTGPQTILVPVCPKANQVPDYTAPWTARITRCTTHQPPDFTAARKAGISGWGAWVVVQPTIDQNGNVESVEVVSGEPTLAKAAIEAVLMMIPRSSEAPSGVHVIMAVAAKRMTLKVPIRLTSMM